MRTPPSTSYHQQGAALVVALLFLVVLTLIGIGAMGTSGLELLMAGNTKLQSDALTKAENTLLTAGTDVTTKVSNHKTTGVPLNFTATNGYYNLTDKPPPDGSHLSDPTWWASADTNAVTATDGEYVVEYLGCQVLPGEPMNSCVSGTAGSAVHMHRITAHRKEPKGAERIVQATYATLDPL